MESGMGEAENELCKTLIQALRFVLYNSAFNKHLLNVYAQVIYQPLCTERKIMPIKAEVEPKIQTSSELEKLTSEALAKADQVLAKVARVATDETDNVRDTSRDHIEEQKHRNAEVKRGKPAVKKQREAKKETKKKKPEIAKDTKAMPKPLSAAPEVPIVADVSFKAEREAMIARKAAEEKYKKIKKAIKEMRKKFNEQVDKETQARTIKINSFTQKLTAMTFKCTKKVETGIKDYLIQGAKLRMVETIVNPKLENTLASIKESNEKLMKIHLIYEGWLYSKFFTEDLIVDDSLVGSFIEHPISSPYQPTRVCMAISEYSSYTEQAYMLMKAVSNARKDQSMKKEVMQMARRHFEGLELRLRVELGKCCRRIGSYIVKAGAKGEPSSELLDKLITMHYIVSSFRAPKCLICYSRR